LSDKFIWETRSIRDYTRHFVHHKFHYSKRKGDKYQVTALLITGTHNKVHILKQWSDDYPVQSFMEETESLSPLFCSLIQNMTLRESKVT